MAPNIAEVTNTHKIFFALMAFVGASWNMAAPVVIERLPTDIAVQRPQPIKSASNKMRSATPVGMLVKITRRIVPDAMD